MLIHHDRKEGYLDTMLNLDTMLPILQTPLIPDLAVSYQYQDSRAELYPISIYHALHNNIVSSVITKELSRLRQEKLHPQVLLLKGLVWVIPFLHVV